MLNNDALLHILVYSQRARQSLIQRICIRVATLNQHLYIASRCEVRGNMENGTLNLNMLDIQYVPTSRLNPPLSSAFLPAPPIGPALRYHVCVDCRVPGQTVLVERK